MTIDELKELLPFYAAGTLEPEEKKRIDEALESSEELRKELQFWAGAEKAISGRAAHAAAGHVSAEEVVDYAMGILVPERRMMVEHHLQSCRECSEEYQFVKSSLTEEPVVKPSVGSRLAAFTKSVRFVYAIPAVTAMIVIAFLYFNTDGKDSHQPPIPGQTPPIITEAPHVVDESMSLWLTYQSEMRSPSQRKTLTLALSEHVAWINAFVAIPHNNVNGIRYAVTVGTGKEIRTTLPDSLERYASSSVHDSLRIRISRSLVPRPGDTLNITIREILPERLNSLNSEQYSFSILIAGNSKR